MITIIYLFRCDGCSDKQQVEMQWYLGSQPLTPWVPDGWYNVNDKLYCSRHKVIVKIDQRSTHIAEGKLNIA